MCHDLERLLKEFNVAHEHEVVQQKDTRILDLHREEDTTVCAQAPSE